MCSFLGERIVPQHLPLPSPTAAATHTFGHLLLLRPRAAVLSKAPLRTSSARAPAVAAFRKCPLYLCPEKSFAEAPILGQIRCCTSAGGERACSARAARRAFARARPPVCRSPADLARTLRRNRRSSAGVSHGSAGVWPQPRHRGGRGGVGTFSRILKEPGNDVGRQRNIKKGLEK
jgi:hypothetical protein